MSLLRSALFGVFIIVSLAAMVHAQIPEELQSQIEKNNSEIEKLRQEILQLQGELNATNAQKQTLQTAVKAIDLNIQKLTKSISLTQAQIAQKDKEIGVLSGDITTTAGNISVARGQVANSLRQLAAADQQPLVLAMLAGGTLSSMFDEIATLETLRSNIQNRIEDLSSLKADLEVDKTDAEGKRRELASLNQTLTREKQGLAIARAEQNKLLEETKNKESTYQAQIAQKQAQQEAFEQQLRDFEAQLNLTVNPGSFAAPKAGVLRWPVASPYITQYFGNTKFATQNPQIYGNRGHNAIDLRASDGTPIMSARTGVIEAIGNTDEQRGCYSYGKWVLVRHDNGLSTLYAHLSLISVGVGNAVTTGQLLGYSGRTGYATGPHLHFGVFATAGVRVQQFGSSINCKQVKVPIVDPTAYLNPLSYLPSL